MLELMRFADLFKFKRVLLVGDPEQLQPIEEGRPFADLIEANAVTMTRLETNHRSDATGGIASLARDVGRETFTRTDLESGKYIGVSFTHAHGAAALDAALKHYRKLIEAGAQPRDIAILTPFKNKSFALSVPNLNAAVRVFLGYDVRRASIGEIVVGTDNDYNRNIINGSRGVVTCTGGIDANGAALPFIIEFEGMNAPSKSTTVERDGLPKNVAYGYASTIHKAQGSEFEHVIVIVDGSHEFLLKKQAFYTAVTRARASLAIIGDLDAAENMSRSPDRRTTVLQPLLGLEGPARNSRLDYVEKGIITDSASNDGEPEF
jgi:exodeoxyribonuclease V alpha subunit